MEVENKSRLRILEYLPLFVLLILMFLIHRYVFLYGEDYYYSEVWQSDTVLLNLIQKDLVNKGQSWLSLLIAIILKWDIYLFRILNPLVLTIFSYIMAKVSYREVNVRQKDYALIVISYLIPSLFLLSLPRPLSNVSILNASMSVTYIYSTFLVLFSAVVFFNRSKNRKKTNSRYERNSKNNKTNLITLLILSFLTGSTQIQTAIMGIILFLISFYLEDNKSRNNTINNNNTKNNKQSIREKSLVIYAWLLGFMPLISSKLISLNDKKENREHFRKYVSNLVIKNITSLEVLVLVIVIILGLILYVMSASEKVSGVNNNRGTLFTKLLVVRKVITRITLVVSFLHIYHIVLINLGKPIKPWQEVVEVIFPIIYLLLLIYTAIIYYLAEKSSFFPGLIISAIVGQLVNVFINPDLTNSFSITIPSFILLFIFVTHGVLLSIKREKRNYVVYSILTLLLLSSGIYYYFNFMGYRDTSFILKNNITNIEDFKKGEVNTINLTVTPDDEYGYRLDLWNEMPKVMKDYYNIDEKDKIKYSRTKLWIYLGRKAVRFSPILKYLNK